MARQHRERVGADLVRGVAVRRDPVGAGEHRVDVARPAISEAAAESTITAFGMPAVSSSQAVSRAPWSSGRVSSTQTWASRPRSHAARSAPTALP